MDLANLAVEFIKELFEEYFVKRNKKTFKDRYITGSQYIGIHKDTKIFHDDDLQELLILQNNKDLKIKLEKYDTTIIDEKNCIVYGFLTVIESSQRRNKLRFSVVCTKCGEELKVVHAHFSMAIDLSFEKLQKELILTTAQVVLNQKRYEVIKNSSELILFDYYPEKDKIVFDSRLARKNGFPRTINKFLNRVLTYGLLYKSSVANFLEAFDKVKQGVQEVETEIVVWQNSEYRMYNVKLHNIQLDLSLAKCVVGIAKDITAEKLLLQEKKYKEITAAKANTAYVVNITKDEFIEPIKVLPQEYATRQGDSFSKFIENFAEEEVHPQERKLYLENFSLEKIKRHYQQGIYQYSFSYRKKTDHKKYKWLESNACLLEHSMTKEIIAYFQVADITEVKNNEKRLSENERYNKFLLENNTFIIEINFTKNIITRGKELLIQNAEGIVSNGYTEQLSLGVEKVVYSEDAAAYLNILSRQNILQQFYSGKKNINFEFRKKTVNNSVEWFVLKLYLLEDEFSKEVKGLMHIENITESKKRELELVHRSERDGLTGFYNKSTTQKCVEQLLLEKDELIGIQALLLYDLDYFKNINDKFGHLFGDQVLVELAGIVKNIVDERSIVGRVGGDEFLLFLTGYETKQQILDKAEAIVTALKRQYNKSGKSQVLSASVGVAFYPEHGRSYKQLYENADKALYLAKDLGKSQVAICDKKFRK